MGESQWESQTAQSLWSSSNEVKNKKSIFHVCACFPLEHLTTNGEKGRLEWNLETEERTKRNLLREQAQVTMLRFTNNLPLAVSRHRFENYFCVASIYLHTIELTISLSPFSPSPPFFILSYSTNCPQLCVQVHVNWQTNKAHKKHKNTKHEKNRKNIQKPPTHGSSQKKQFKRYLKIDTQLKSFDMLPELHEKFLWHPINAAKVFKWRSNISSFTGSCLHAADLIMSMQIWLRMHFWSRSYGRPSCMTDTMKTKFLESMHIYYTSVSFSDRKQRTWARSNGYTGDSICSLLSSAMLSFVTRRTNLNHITFSLLNRSSSSPIVQQLFKSLGTLWYPLHIIHACMHDQINNQKKIHSPAVVLMWAKDHHCFHKLAQTYSVLEKHPTDALLQNQRMQLCDFLLLLFWVFAPAVNCHTNKKQHISRTSMPKGKGKTTASLFTFSTDSFPFSLRCQTLGTTTCQTQQSFQALRVGRERTAGMGGGGGSSSSSSSSPGRCWREWGGGCCMILQVFKRLRMLYPYSLGRNSRALLAFHSTRRRLFERPERPEKRVSGTSSSGRFGARKLRKHKMGGTSEESTGEREKKRKTGEEREKDREDLER